MQLLRLAGIGDPWLLLAALSLGVLGPVLVQAADPGLGEPFGAEAVRHVAYLVVGLGAMFALGRLDYRALRLFVPVVYVGAIGLLVLVLAIGTSEFGAQRWIDAGPFTVQPSEFAKVAMVLAVAALAAGIPPGLRGLSLGLGLLALPLGLILLQPDTGTSIVLMIAWGSMVLAWGTSWRLVGGALALGLSMLPLVFAVAVPEYQRERLAVFFDPERDPLGSGFSLRQVEFALGNGGWTGIGLSPAPGDSAMELLSARTSDFVFAHIAEALGYAGGVAVLLLFAVLLWRGTQIAVSAPDAFGRMLAVGLTATLVMQACIHVAVNLRLFPATGIPLPLVSQGGSALLAMFAAVGVLQSIAAQRAAARREAWPGEGWGGHW